MPSVVSTTLGEGNPSHVTRAKGVPLPEPTGMAVRPC